MMQNIRFSIALCTYNGANYLNEQIESIINQTYPPYQIIVSDDNSSDATWNMLEQWKNRFPALFEIYRQESNIGFNRNFSFVLTKVKGDYVSLSDQDDIWYPYKLAEIAKEIELNTKTEIFHHDEDILVSANNGGLKVNKNENDYWLPYEGNGVGIIFVLNRLTGHVMTIKSSFLVEIIPIPQGIIYDWWICAVAATKGNVQYINKKLMKYRLHSESAYFSNVSNQLKEITTPICNALSHFKQINGMTDMDKIYLIGFQKNYQKHISHRFDFSLFFFLLKYRKDLFKKFHINGSRCRKELFLIRLCRAYSKW